MSSLNLYPTFHYSQPDEYRFSHDSVFLAREVFELEKKYSADFSQVRALDLCSGSGIVGLDWLYHICHEQMTPPKSLDFLELQTVYDEHFNQNSQKLFEIFPQISQTTLSTHWKNYSDFQSSSTYQIILCNPPYFRVGQGALSNSDFKNRCRFFLDSDFVSLLACIKRNLSFDGRAYVLIPDLKPHGIDIEKEIFEFCSLNLWSIKVDSSRKIRKTNLYIFSA